MADNSKNNTRIFKNTIFLYARMFFVLLVSLYTTRIVLRELGVVDYGIYNVVAGFVSMFAFLNSAMNNTTQRFYNFERGAGSIVSLRNIYNTALQTQFLIAFITLIALETFGVIYINHKMVVPDERMFAANIVFQFSVFSLMMLIIQIPYSAAIISHEKMDYFAIVSIVDVLLKLGLVLSLPYVPFDKLIYFAILSLLISTTNFLLYFIYSKRHFPEIQLVWYFNKAKLKEMITFSGWNVLGAFAFTMQGQGLNVLINSFFGPVVNAARGVAFQIHSAINGFSENIATAFRPQLVESYAKEDYERTKNLMFTMSKFCFILLCTLSVPVIFELRTILTLWLGNNIPEHTIPFTVLVILNMLVCSLNMPISQTVQATGKVKYYQIIRSFLIVSTLPLAWLSLKLGAEPIAVFWVTLIISIINQPLSMAILHYNFEYSYKKYIKRVLFPFIVFLFISPIAPLLINLLFPNTFARLVLNICVSFLWSGTLIYLCILTVTEKQLLKNVIFGRMKKRKI